MSDNGWKEFFETYQKGDQLLNDDRKKLMNAVGDWIIDRFGFYPEQNDKITVSKAIISLFPCFKTSPSKFDGIVSFFQFCVRILVFQLISYLQDLIFNPSTSTGWLVSILKTRRTQNKVTKPKKTTIKCCN